MKTTQTVLGGKVFVEQLMAQVVEPGIQRLLSRPYFEELNNGTLSRARLKGYAIQHYLHNRAICFAFPLAVIKNANNDTLCKYFTHQFIEESSQPDENGHPGLCMKFGKALGLTQEDFDNAFPIPECVGHTGLVLRGVLVGHPADSRASAIVNESLVCNYSRVFVDALPTHYGLSRDDCEFFVLHSEVDVEHVKLAAATVEQFATTAELQAKARRAAETAVALKIMKFDGIYDHYGSD